MADFLSRLISIHGRYVVLFLITALESHFGSLMTAYFRRERPKIKIWQKNLNAYILKIISQVKLKIQVLIIRKSIYLNLV